MGCFANDELAAGVLRDADKNVHCLTVVNKLPCGTETEMRDVSVWENDKLLVNGRRTNKYWPIVTSMLERDTSVVFDDQSFLWHELTDAGYYLASTYPCARVSVDPSRTTRPPPCSSPSLTCCTVRTQTPSSSTPRSRSCT